MSQTFERVAAAAGAVVVLMSVPAVLLYPNLHPPYEPELVRAAYVQGAATAAVSVGLQLLVVVPFVIFLVAVWGRIRASSERLAMATIVGGMAFLAVLIVWQAVLAGVLLQANFVDPDADLRPILSVVSSVDQAITMPLAVMSGAAGIGILGGHMLPRWLGWLGVVVAVLGIVGVLAIPAAFTLEAARGPLASANPLALLLFLIWTVGVAVAFVRSPGPASTSC